MSDMREMLADMAPDALTDPIAAALDEVRACDPSTLGWLVVRLNGHAAREEKAATNADADLGACFSARARAMRAVAALVMAARETKS